MAPTAQKRLSLSIVRGTKFTAIMLAAFCFSAVFVAVAQTSPAEPTIALIDEKIAAVEADNARDATSKQDAIALLTRAKETMTAKRERAERLAAYLDESNRVDALLAEIANQLADAENPIDLPPETAPHAELRNAFALLEAERDSLTTSLSEKRADQTALSNRQTEIAEEVADAREAVAALLETPAIDTEAAEPGLEDARLTLALARRVERQAAIDDLQAELATIPARQSILAARLDLAENKIHRLEAAIEILRGNLGETELGRAEARIVAAQADIDRVAELSPALLRIARENLNLAEALRQSASRKPDLGRTILQAEQRAASLEYSADTVQLVLAAGRLNEDMGNLLRSVRDALPDVQALSETQFQNEQDRVALQLNQIFWQDRLRGLDHAETASRRLLTSGPEASPDDLETGSELLVEAVRLVEARNVLLTELIGAAREETDLLAAQEIILNQLAGQTDDLSELLDRRLLWLRTGDRFNRTWLTRLPDGVAWILSPRAWRQAAEALITQAGYHPAATLALFLVIFLLAGARRALLRRLAALAERVGHVGRDSYWATPLAFGASILLALPWPIGLGAAGWLLSRAGAEAPVFTQGLSQTLVLLSAVLFLLILCRIMCRADGLFDKHFKWNEKARTQLRYHLGWFAWLQGIAILLFGLASASENPALRYGIGLLAFSAASIGLAAFAFQMFKPKTGIVSELAIGPTASALIAMMFPLIVLEPLIIGALPFLGYFDTATRLQFNVLQSGALLLAAAVVYGLSIRPFMVGNRRFALRKAKERRAKAEAARASMADAEASGQSTPISLEENVVDAQEISDQVRAILQSIAAAIFLIGLWLVWRPIIPALGIAEDIVLWQNLSVIDGAQIYERVTLWNLALTLLILFAGGFAAKNISGLLEFGVFEQLNLDPGTRYATVTITQYIIVAVAIVTGFSQLGVDWSKLQWIIAALGVGLGFGLQEIVANFVSGLIILFERPIRVGDIVSIGGLSGTVSNIKIRATTVTDFDNRQVLLPNKTIITENVTNWTLNDAVTRLLLSVGVAYGSDIDAVRAVILNTVKAHPDVLEKPPPSVFFMRHSESSLDFEARVFVASPARRLPTTHELNTAINQALAENGIEIPFPQTDVHVKVSKTAPSLIPDPD